MSSVEEVIASVGQPMSIERFFVIAPFTALIVCMVLIGGGAVWFIMSSHITSLKEFIEYLKIKRSDD